MRKFLFKHIVFPLKGRWLRGMALLLLWTISFIALPAISGWFLAACSLAFLTASSLFSYIAPSAAVRLLSILRTAMRYFERMANHKTTLEAQRRLQLGIFKSVARFPYFKKQFNNNASILENSTYGVDMILNHILLWILPFTTLVIAVILYFLFLKVLCLDIALEFLLSSAILLFLLPQFILLRNRRLYAQLKQKREENNQHLMQSFRGRIEIVKYHLEDKALAQQEESRRQIERLEYKLQANAIALQSLVGFGLSSIAVFILWHSEQYSIDAPMAIGLFFGIMAQAELAEMLFAGKSEKSSVAHQVKDLDAIINNVDIAENSSIASALEDLRLQNMRAQIPQSPIRTEAVSTVIAKGEWVALYGETGKGKTTLLNSLFFPEYQLEGYLQWNGKTVAHLPVPECIYVTQKAYLLTGTLKENFEGYKEQEIEKVMTVVDLNSWYVGLSHGLDTFLGENGESLSGGQRKKLLLAQALLKKPQLLVVDEPTAGVSTENALHIFNNIRKEFPEMSLLVSTHLIDFETVVDKVIRL